MCRTDDENTMSSYKGSVNDFIYVFGWEKTHQSNLAWKSLMCEVKQLRKTSCQESAEAQETDDLST